MATIKKEKALDVVRQMVADGQVSQEVAEKYFPELKESKNERIRNFISNELACLRATDGKGSDRYEELTEAIAWLEKQGKQKSINDLTQQEAMDIAVAKCFEQGEQKISFSLPTEGEFPYNNPADTLDGEIENIWEKLSCDNKFTATKDGFHEVVVHFVNWYKKQGEQKTIDEIAEEVCKNKTSAVAFLKLAGIINEKGELAKQYRQDEQKSYASETMNEKGDFDDCFTRMMEKEQKPADKVSLDFKKGDILYEQKTMSILLVYERNGSWLMTFCDYWMLKEKFHVEFPYENYGFVQEMSLVPATKEQRDLLFQKMKEAGYEWDAVKKELKKIEQKPQSTWKPSDEQMYAIMDAIDYLGCTKKVRGYLVSLYEDLKKLREE